MARRERQRLRIAGTIPEELFEWASRQIVERRYFKWSHLIEVAITKLREDEGGDRKLPAEKKG